MSQIAVSQLKFRGDVADAAPAEFRITDALRTEIADTDRIVIVREMKLGRMSTEWRSRGMADQVGRAWHEIVASAVHGSASHAASANCVWFADAAEARTVLMALLASGRHPVAWYWRHVVPDWAGQPIDQWLSVSIARSIASQDEAACLDIIEQAIAAGAMPSVLRAIAALAKLTVSATLVPSATTVGGAIQNEMESPQHLSTIQTNASDRIVHAAAATILSSLPKLVLTAIRELSALPVAASMVPQLALILVRRAQPDVLANPMLLDRLVSTTERLLHGRPDPREKTEIRHSAPRPPSNRVRAIAPEKFDRKSSGEQSRLAETEQHTERLTQLAAAVEKEDVQQAVAVMPAALFREEIASDAAGLLLLANALRILGWREWLAEHPQWLLHRPSAAFMDKVAQHYQVSETDPARQIWADIQPVPDDLDEALTLWRRGLDGWLRRRTGKRLASIIRRRGWIIQESDRVSVRFRLMDIDMGMRRHALDRDPGWVDWLGFSLRYHFDDRPIVAGFAP